jgi:radical SAM superfamily enzyme YgiQ (UPF0313 family)
MKILLVIPTVQYGYNHIRFMASSDFPVGFAYIAASLKNNGYRTYGLNPNNDSSYLSPKKMLRDKLQSKINEIDPDVVCLGGLCSDFLFIKDAINITRKASRRAIIICGGGIISNDPSAMLEALNPDFCIIGEGEEVIIKLLNSIEASNLHHDNVPNIGYYKDNQPFFTKTSFEYIDLKERAVPDYDLFGIEDMLDNYGLVNRNLYRYIRTNPRIMTIITARGCPFNCTFCIHREGRGEKYRARSISNIMKEIHFLYNKYKFNILIILDELFAANKTRLTEFCEKITNGQNKFNWDFNWMFQTHASAALDTEDMIKAKKAGCFFFSYGIESASPAVLKSMNKRTNPQQIVEAIERSNKADIGFGGNFIFGDVAETEETILETISFFKKHCTDCHIYLSTVRPYPGSVLYDKCITLGKIKNNDSLDFYKNIDTKPLNMTNIPNSDWLIFSNQLLSTAIRFPWVKLSKATSCVKDNSNPELKWTIKSKVEVNIITSVCPHCHNNCIFREPLPIKQRRIVNIIHKISSIIYREQWMLPQYLLGKLKSIMRNSSPTKSKSAIIKIIETIPSEYNQCDDSFITGCPSCNKRFKVLF